MFIAVGISMGLSLGGGKGGGGYCLESDWCGCGDRSDAQRNLGYPKLT